MTLLEKLQEHAATAKGPSLTPAEAAGLVQCLLAAGEVVTAHWNEQDVRQPIRKLEALASFAGVGI